MKRYVMAAILLASGAMLAPPASASDHPAESAALLAVKPDAASGKVMVTLPAPDASGVAAQYIYLAQVESGLGSAAVGVDRGANLANGIVRFRRIGSKVAVELVNSRFVATEGTAAEQEGVAHSFPGAVLWIGDVASTAGDGSFTFDFAPFL